jgi:hypothetical protein
VREIHAAVAPAALIGSGMIFGLAIGSQYRGLTGLFAFIGAFSGLLLWALWTGGRAPKPAPPPPPPAVEGVELKLSAPELRDCQVCGGPLETNLVACARCATPHHADCWSYTRRCSTYGCGGSRSVPYAKP